MIKFLLLLCLLGAVTPRSAYRRSLHPKDDAGTCGYPSCTASQPGKLNVHLVPHTHDDVGWLKTVDQYYYGSRTDIQNAGVQYIIDSVVDELIHDPNKKFIYVETSFFWKWWLEQTDDLRHQVKQLVNNGQLEFIGGGWSMNDEATTHYQSVIDNFAWGLRKLNDTFGTCGQPKIGWQIDPFGHSRETASIMAQLGFDGLFFARLDYQDKNQRLKTKTMEMIWEGSPSLGSDADLLTSALYWFYGPPSGGFCFDIECGDDPVIDNKKSPEYNVDKKVDDFIKAAKEQAQYYGTNNLIQTFGMDFNYQYAHKNYKNMDKLIRYVNQRQESGSDVNVFYSTPSCYVKSLNEANITWPTKSDDFFPYASDPHAYWTGYFTSRPTLKFFERKGNNLLQVCKQLAAIANLESDVLIDIDVLKEAMGIMQHHDAIAGTEKQHVAEDYARLLTQGFAACGLPTSQAIAKLSTKDESAPVLSLRSCPALNASQCSISENSDNIIVNLYNPISRPKNHYVRLPVLDGTYLVRDSSGNEVPNQVVPIPEPLFKLPGRSSNATSELVFKATDIPALGFKSYYISKSARDLPTSRISREKLSITNGKSHVRLDRNSGLPTIVTEKDEEIALGMEWYEGALGDNGASERRSSGAYIFRPNGTTTTPISRKASNVVVEGDIVSEIHTTLSDWASIVTRQYTDEPSVEVEWLVGPIPIDDNKGKEIVLKYTSDLKTNGAFWTDSSGRETIQRIRDFRPTWDLEVQEPVAGNYYPITTDLSMSDKDAGREVAIIIDRAQGGSSLQDGQLELMVHRRLLHDDAFGVGEALNETAFGTGLVARGKHWVIVGGVEDPEWLKSKQLLKQEKVLDVLISLNDAGNVDYDTWLKSYNLEFSGLTNPLPESVQILTLEPWKGRTYLIRLEHLWEKKLSQDPVTVNLENLFTTFDIVDCRETTLGANKWLDESTRLQWNKETNEVPKDRATAKPLQRADLNVTLNPRQIRTFVCEVSPKSKSQRQ